MDVDTNRRSLTIGEIEAAGLCDFFNLLKMQTGSVRSWSTSEVEIRPILLKGGKDYDLGAWACPPGWKGLTHYEVWITEDYAQVLKYQCLQAAPHLLRVLTRMGVENPLVKLWGDLPATQCAADVFGRLVSTAASTFIVGHELAHIMLGHLVQPPEDIALLLRDQKSVDKGRHRAPQAAAIDEVDAVAAFDRLDASTSDSLWSQVREVDADSNSLFWTQHHLSQLGKKMQGDEKISQLEMRVMEVFLLSRPGVLYLTVLGAILALLLIDPTSRRGPLVKGSHPPTAARALMLIKAEAALRAGNVLEPLFDPLGFATSLLATLAAPGLQRSGGLPPPIRHSNSEIKQAYVYDMTLGLLGLKEALASYSHIEKHYVKLALVRRAVSPHLRSYLPDESIFNWWKTG